ncbi:MAG: DUF6391 domain-containing protein [Xenococcus sp. MO_188.B8]|nr:DUF6391 domain-containing protein [Xenococcus sp. MO_188.B8]
MSQATTYENWDWFTPQQDQDIALLQQWGFIPGIKDFLVLRQVHALEHATVWMLSSLEKTKSSINSRSNDNENIGGLSTEKGFFLYGDINLAHLRQAVNLALTRLQRGEWELALHPRCGTNASVATLLTTGMILTTHLMLPREPIGQLLGMGLATVTATYLAPELGMAVQKYITTAIPFNLKISKIAKTIDMWGNQAYFVGLQWQTS